MPNAESMARPPSAWHLIWLVPLISIALAVLVWLLSWVLTIELDGMTLSGTQAEVLETCEFKGVRGIVVTLHCGSVMRRALVAGVRPLRSVTNAVARDGLAGGLTDYATLAEENVVSCELMAGAPLRARCTGEVGDLARFLVDTGAAAADAPELLDAEDAARVARAGLHADSLAAVVNRRVLIQTWLATAIGLTGAVAAFYYSSVRTMRAWELTQQNRKYAARNTLKLCNKHHTKWVFSPLEKAEDFAESLRTLETAIYGLDAPHDWITHQCDEIAKVIRIVDKVKGSTQEPKTEEVSKRWNQVYKTVRDKLYGA